MQAAVFLTPLASIKSLALPWKSIPKLQTSTRSPSLNLKAAPADQDNVTFDYYGSKTSVFPAEACETIGGEACDVEMYPEVKLKPEAKKPTAGTAAEPVDRDYVEYDEPKTVFPGEACDDLGGEFCEPEYQKGVY
ncbi:hypothetical protein FEM48_Zijuj10G0173900 [Ziziphus jujuba var. spinosa]|uniref:Light-regulated protein-like n=1 Tax=Ziziphus jujuba var. spinosa TaxID=714518 RepID=A0A978UPQ5_ZIZJJ|nr:hypothetical protein FEM48_Zijuj10G0173900 [Ziziphus jujuba var. spinosa]